MVPERSLRRQVAATISLAIVGVMALAMMLAVMLLKRTVEQRFDARLMRASGELQGAIARSADGGITLDAEVPSDPVFSERSSGWGWVVRDGQRVLARSRSLAAGQERAELPLGGLSEVQAVEADGKDWRAITLRIRGDDALAATVAMPQNAVWTEVAADAALLLPAIAILALLLVLIAWSQARRALQPVEALAVDLDQLKQGRQTALPKTPFRELNNLTGLINDLLVERRGALEEARDNAAHLAHGLKTPLAVLSARFGTSGSTPDPKVIDAVEGMNRMIRLHLAEARTGRASAIRPEALAIRPIVHDLAMAFRHTLHRSDLSVTNEIPHGFKVALSADDAQELFGNLLENAFRHAATGVCIKTSAFDTIIVSNDGELFPDDIIAAVSAMSGTDVGFPHKMPGDGLGLQIAHGIVQRHGGTLTLSNAEGPSATVTVVFS